MSGASCFIPRVRLGRRAALVAALLSPVSVHGQAAPVKPRFQFITLDPGHFHASLVQKFSNPDVDTVVHVFAPASDDVTQHLLRVETFNKRPASPTHWSEKVYTGADYLEKMLASKTGNIVVIAGNNARKTEYIVRSVGAGLNVLADKPMVRTPADLVALQQAFKTANAKHVLLYDIMTERSEVTTQLQRELSMRPEVFGTLTRGTLDQPAVTKESVHYFSKIVAGAPLKRPEWFFDVRQEGMGIVDVTTHLVDLVQWEAFPDQVLSDADVTMLRASRSATGITRAQFKQVTGADDFPAYLRRDVKDGALQVSSNGVMDYTLRGVHARVSVRWNFEPPAGTSDTHFSVMHGTKANLMIRQGAEQKFKPVLYVERVPAVDQAVHDAALRSAIVDMGKRYPGIALRQDGNAWVVVVPAALDVGHEAHFAQVTDRYLGYLRAGAMPGWEVPNMLVKYGTIMKAYTMSGAK